MHFSMGFITILHQHFLGCTSESWDALLISPKGCRCFNTRMTVTSLGLGFPTFDGWNPANQLRLVVYPRAHYLQVFVHMPGGTGFQPSTVKRRTLRIIEPSSSGVRTLQFRGSNLYCKCLHPQNSQWVIILSFRYLSFQSDSHVFVASTFLYDVTGNYCICFRGRSPHPYMEHVLVEMTSTPL